MENKSPSVFSGKHSELTGRILNCFFKVHANLGYGFAEKVYQRALMLELIKSGLVVVEQKPIQVYYDGEIVGEFFADMVVNNLIILELKSIRQILDEHISQLLSYLKSTHYEIGLVLNFGPKPTHERKVFDNERKGSLVWMSRN